MVDDEPWALRGIRNIIPWQDYGFRSVDTYQDPQAALEAILATRPEVVLTDVRMPGMTGLELIERCREAGCTSLFVIVSAYAEFEYAKKAMEIGAVSYILKPLEEGPIRELAQKLSRQLRGRLESELQYSVRSLVLRVLTTGAVTGLDEALEKSGLFEPPCRIAFMAHGPDSGSCFRISSDLVMAVFPGDRVPPLREPAGISGPCTQVSGAVWEALVACYTQRFYAGEGVLEYSSCKEDPTGLVEAVIQGVDRGDMLRVRSSLKQLESFLQDRRCMLHEVTFIYNALLQRLMQYLPRTDLQEDLHRFSSCFQLYGVMRTADALFQSIRVLTDDCLQRTSEDAEPEDAAERAVRYIDRHYHETMTLEQVSEKFNISLSHLCRQFKRITGTPFTEYVTRKRIDRACILLRETQQPIAQIGEQVGYPDYFYFNKVFKKVRGISPSVYRREQQSLSGRDK
ncbi:MAG: response regulator [Clostridia bacterium]|nr:response regulator [Clostridia bacterium]